MSDRLLIHVESQDALIAMELLPSMALQLMLLKLVELSENLSAGFTGMDGLVLIRGSIYRRLFLHFQAFYSSLTVVLPDGHIT